MNRRLRSKSSAPSHPGPLQTAKQEEGSNGQVPSVDTKLQDRRVKGWMVELQPNSNIFYKAYQIDQMKQLWRFKFPACQETHHKDVFHWLTKHNPRIWHGKMAKSAWSKVKDAAGVTVDGAWRPRVPPSQSRGARRRSPASTLQLQQSAGEPSDAVMMDVEEDCQSPTASKTLATNEDRSSGNTMSLVAKRNCRKQMPSGGGYSHLVSAGSAVCNQGLTAAGGCTHLLTSDSDSNQKSAELGDSGQLAVKDGDRDQGQVHGLEQNGLKVDIKTQDKSDQGVDMTETEDSTVTLAEVCNTTDTPSLGMAALPNAAKKKKIMPSLIRKTMDTVTSPLRKKGSEKLPAHRNSQSRWTVMASSYPNDQAEPGLAKAAASHPASPLSSTSSCKSLESMLPKQDVTPSARQLYYTRSHNTELVEKKETDLAAQVLLSLSKHAR